MDVKTEGGILSWSTHPVNQVAAAPHTKGGSPLSLAPFEWAMQARCQGTADELFVEGAQQKKARLVCRGCAVRSHCLAEALDNRIEWGVWGGMTERERRHLLRVRADVESWASLLLGKKGPHASK